MTALPILTTSNNSKLVIVSECKSSPVIGLHHMCQQSCSEDPARGLPQPPTAQPPLQLGESPAQAEACQHTHCSIALEPETLNLQEETI